MSSLTQFRTDISIQQVVWMQDGNRVFVLGWNTGRSVPEVGILNLAGGNFVSHREGIYGGIVGSPVESRVAMTTSEELLIYSPDTKVTKIIKMKSIAGNMGDPDIAWSPNGEYLAVTADAVDDPKLVLLTKDGRILSSRKAVGFISYVSWNCGSDTVAFWDRNGLNFINLRSELVGNMPGHYPMLNPTYDALAYQEVGKGAQALVLLHNGTKKVISRIKSIQHLVWSPDGSKLLIGKREWNHGSLEGKYYWMLYDMYTDTLTQVIDTAGSLCFPVWSPNSNSIMFVMTGVFQMVLFEL